MDSQLVIRSAQTADFDAIWPIFHQVIARADTYALDASMGRAAAQHYWMRAPAATFVAVRDERVVGTYYIKPNFAGPGSHICNAGYMVDEKVRGGGVGRRMAEHSFDAARRMGFRAMQYNMVVSSNHAAIGLWERLGFAVVGRVPDAFLHPEQGYVAGLIMHRSL